MSIDYDGRIFRSVGNTGSGEVDGDTRFHYRQEGDVVWATYRGGGVKFGSLVAKVLDGGALDMRYNHVNASGGLMTGQCRSVPERLPDGRLRLHETWQWTSGDRSSGQSVIEEVEIDAD